MKEDHRKNKKAGWRILGVAVVLAVVGAGLFLWKIYKDGELFDPELFVNSQDIKENQVNFRGRKIMLLMRPGLETVIYGNGIKKLKIKSNLMSFRMLQCCLRWRKGS